MVGLLVAGSYFESSLIKYGGYAVLASPLSCAFAFAWILTVKNNARFDSIDAEKVWGCRADCGSVCTTRRKGGKSWVAVNRRRFGRWSIVLKWNEISGDTDSPDPIPTAARRARQSASDRGWI